MEKSQKKTKGKGKSSHRTPIITKATTQDKDQALSNVIGMWADREETKDIKKFRQKLKKPANFL